MTLGASWGATASERGLALPCDRLLENPTVRLHRAISIDASPQIVFRWLCQLRVAPYSYDLLDNLGRSSPRELTPGLEYLQTGQRFMTIFALDSFAPGEHITLRARRTAVTYAVLAQGNSARLLVRVLFAAPGPRLSASLIARALALGDLAMMRRQLRTLKKLSERDASPQRS